MFNKDDEILEYIEHLNYVGYYYVPNNKNIIISKNGEVINLITDNKLKNNIGEDGYVRTSCQINDKIKSFKIHRLLAETFIGRPLRHLNKPFSELEVNHIDGNKTNYTLSNLEWVTKSENAIHAINTGLTNHNSVLARNIQTNKIIEFACVNFCAANYEINSNGLRNHLKSKHVGTITKNWNVFKLNDNSDWSTLEEKHYQENNWDVNYGVWCVTDINTNMTYIFHNLSDAAKAYNFTISAVNSFRLKYGENVPYKGYLFTYDHKPSAYILKQLPSRAQNARAKGVPLKVTNLTTGEIHNYPSTYLACRCLPVTSGRIEFAFKNRNGIVDNYKFEKIA